MECKLRGETLLPQGILAAVGLYHIFYYENDPKNMLNSFLASVRRFDEKKFDLFFQ